MEVAYQPREALKIKAQGLHDVNRRRALAGLPFPWLIRFILLKVLPVLAAFVFAPTDFQMSTPEETSFVGPRNYIRFFGDINAGAG